MRKWSRILLGSLTLIVGAACGDTPTSPTAPPPAAADLVPVTSPLDAQVRSTIDALFPRLVGDAIGAAWNVIVGELILSRKPGLTDKQRTYLIELARKQLLALGTFIQSKTGRITPPAGETQDHAAARLILLMSVYVYNGPETVPPDVPSSSDAVVAIVQPSATTTQTVRTPTQHAAVQFPPGSLGETRIIVISQLMTNYPVNCSGPLETKLCQYPQFYEISSFPDTKLQSPAIAAVCHVNSGTSRAPLADHARFRIAHDAPASTADYVEGGTIVDGVEVLPLVLVSGLTSCEGNSYQVGAAPSAPRGALGTVIHWIGEPARRLASALFEQAAPAPAWAIDGIGGGRLSVFSTFAVVDPAGLPDLSVTTDPQLFEGSFAPGDVVPIGNWSVTNTGTATARNVAAGFGVARDSMLTAGVVLGATAGNAASLAPGQSFGGTGASVALPQGIADGTYYVGVRAELNGEGGLADVNIFNNRHTVRIDVRSPATPLTFVLADAATPVVQFGGPPLECATYTEQLSGINASITLPAASAGSGGVTLTAVEQLVSDCGPSPLPANQHSYTADKVTRDGDVVHVTFIPGADNLPQAALDFSGTLSQDLTTLTGTFTWHRIDQPSPLDWTIAMPATLVRPVQIP